MQADTLAATVETARLPDGLNPIVLRHSRIELSGAGLIKPTRWAHLGVRVRPIKLLKAAAIWSAKRGHRGSANVDHWAPHGDRFFIETWLHRPLHFALRAEMFSWVLKSK